jgi:uncharacterized protein YbjT (DUF2867 family)
MRVLITGGTGLLGRALAERLCRAGYEVIALSRRPEPVAPCRRACRGRAGTGAPRRDGGIWLRGPSRIINLAGESIRPAVDRGHQAPHPREPN